MSDVKWIKIVTDVFDNRKIKQIESMPECDAIIVIWFKILCLAGKINDGGLVYFSNDIPYTEQLLATEFNKPLSVIQLALNVFVKFGMIEIADDIIRVSNWEKYQNVEGMERIREQTRNRVRSFRERQKIAMKDDVTLHNATVTEQNKNKNKSKEEHINTFEHESDEMFERLWKKYPRKKGKGSVSKAQKLRLFKIGEEALSKAIDNFVADMDSQHRPEDMFPYGSTFFNSGYVDYLDDEEDQEPVIREKYDPNYPFENQARFDAGDEVDADGYWISAKV